MQQLERRDPEELMADEDEDVDMDDDEEQEDGEGEDDESSSSSEGNKDDDEDDEGDEEADLELRRKIEEALRVNGISAATGDSDDESEEDLDAGVRRGRVWVCMYIVMKYILFAAIHACSERVKVGACRASAFAGGSAAWWRRGGSEPAAVLGLCARMPGAAAPLCGLGSRLGG